MLKFFWNGIKDNGGNLQRAHYSNGKLINSPAGTITIYSKEYSAFSAGIREAFKVHNDTDIITDYFEKDRIRVEPTHPLYNKVREALAAQEAHYAKRFAKKAA